MIKKELSLRMGENVRQCRKDKGYTQEDLAEACNFSAAFCAQVETGSRMMSLPTLVKVSEVLHTTPNILIYGKPKMNALRILCVCLMTCLKAKYHT